MPTSNSALQLKQVFYKYLVDELTQINIFPQMWLSTKVQPSPFLYHVKNTQTLQYQTSPISRKRRDSFSFWCLATQVQVSFIPQWPLSLDEFWRTKKEGLLNICWRPHSASCSRINLLYVRIQALPSSREVGLYGGYKLKPLKQEQRKLMTPNDSPKLRWLWLATNITTNCKLHF